MPEQQPPSKLVEDIERRLEQIQRKVTAASEQVGLTRKIVAAVKPYWNSADKIFMEGKPDTILASGYQVLASFKEQVESLEEQSSDFQGQVQSMMGSATVFANTTGSTASFSGWSLGFDPEPIRQFRYTFDTHDEYGSKLSKVNPALGQTFNAIKSAYLGSPAEGLRQALFLTRQTFDHFFDALVSDNEIRQQTWWSPEAPQKPKSVTRTQRIRYAAEKHVKDPAKRKVLIDGAHHMNNVYQTLQNLHKRGPLDEEKDKEALLEMLNLLRIWVDSLKIS